MPDFGDRRVMACTVADIERWLHEFSGRAAVRCLSVGHERPVRLTGAPGAAPAAVAGPSSGVAPDACFAIDAGGWSIQLSARKLAPRVIALLRMPQLEVVFDYAPEHAGRARAWIAGFDRHTQRGGG